jgi:nucleotide-binding universal stress UspA family protein
MFERILVPLDGSDLSERALQPAFELAQTFGARVNLLRVIPDDGDIFGAGGLGPPAIDIGDSSEKSDWAESEAYLNTTMDQWRATGVPIETRVAVGAEPEMIVQIAAQCGVALIVMATHGRGGLNRFLYGSVAEAVLRGAQRPLLLIPAK